MKLGMVGLGRMGGNMAVRLARGGHEVFGLTRPPATAVQGVQLCETAEQLRDSLTPPRVAWVMVPAGESTEAVLKTLGKVFEPGDIVVDGGNSRYTDSLRRGRELDPVHFVDAGVSGGVWGLQEGYCMMLGGSEADVEVLRPALETLAPPGGWLHAGPPGAGHFVKMVHNGIEYGLLQAYAEGFELMASASEFALDLPAIAGLWRNGSVVRSWLLDLAELALRDDPALAKIRAYVDDSGEGRWTVQEAVERGVPVTNMAHALFARFSSRDDDSFAMRLIAALRSQFGGHPVKREP